MFSGQPGGPPPAAPPCIAPEEVTLSGPQQALTPSDFWEIKSSLVMPGKLLTAIVLSNILKRYWEAVGGALLPK